MPSPYLGSPVNQGEEKTYFADPESREEAGPFSVSDAGMPGWTSSRLANCFASFCSPFSSYGTQVGKLTQGDGPVTVLPRPVQRTYGSGCRCFIGDTRPRARHRPLSCGLGEKLGEDPSVVFQVRRKVVVQNMENDGQYCSYWRGHPGESDVILKVLHVSAPDARS